MSSFQITAKNKESGKYINVWCIDDYFGKHKYGYIIQNKEKDIALTLEQFEREFEHVETI